MVSATSNNAEDFARVQDEVNIDSKNALPDKSVGAFKNKEVEVSCENNIVVDTVDAGIVINEGETSNNLPDPEYVHTEDGEGEDKTTRYIHDFFLTKDEQKR